MKSIIGLWVFVLSIGTGLFGLPMRGNAQVLNFYGAAHSNFQYTGRVDFSNPSLPRFYAPGVYVTASFSGNTCEILLNDEELYGKNHNYISVVVDDRPAKRIKLQEKNNTINIGHDLGKGPHTLVICKSTESGIGYLEFIGIKCEALLKPKTQPSRRIEFIGNSITCGMGSDLSIPCGSTADWFDQHNAYLSYGPLTARALNAQWQLTAVSGIGLIHSCCDMKLTMPDVYDKINLRDNALPWDFSKYQADVVTVCLGQNDGVQDSLKFCGAYVSFVGQLRKVYPKATIICLTSPMADDGLATVQKKYLDGIVSHVNASGDSNVSHYYFSKRWDKGCGSHPSLDEHREIAAELSAAIKKIKHW